MVETLKDMTHEKEEYYMSEDVGEASVLGQQVLHDCKPLEPIGTVEKHVSQSKNVRNKTTYL